MWWIGKISARFTLNDCRNKSWLVFNTAYYTVSWIFVYPQFRTIWPSSRADNSPTQYRVHDVIYMRWSANRVSAHKSAKMKAILVHYISIVLCPRASSTFGHSLNVAYNMYMCLGIAFCAQVFPTPTHAVNGCVWSYAMFIKTQTRWYALTTNRDHTRQCGACIWCNMRACCVCAWYVARTRNIKNRVPRFAWPVNHKHDRALAVRRWAHSIANGELVSPIRRKGDSRAWWFICVVCPLAYISPPHHATRAKMYMRFGFLPRQPHPRRRRAVHRTTSAYYMVDTAHTQRTDKSYIPTTHCGDISPLVHHHNGEAQCNSGGAARVLYIWFIGRFGALARDSLMRHSGSCSAAALWAIYRRCAMRISIYITHLSSSGYRARIYVVWRVPLTRVSTRDIAHTMDLSSLKMYIL